MEFIKQIEEARLTRNKTTLSKFSYKDVCERFYLTLLIVEFLRQFQDSYKTVVDYAKKTESYTTFSQYKVGSTDLHNFIYIIIGNDKALSLLDDPASAKAMQQQLSFPTMAVSRYIKQIGAGTTPTQVFQLFSSIESGLGIKNSDYKKIRRVVAGRITNDRQLLTSTGNKLVHLARTNLRTGDLIDELEKIVTKDKLSSNKVGDKKSIAQASNLSGNTDLYYIAEIVGYKNVFMAIKFLELMEKGEMIPASVQKGFKPAIELLIDIIKGGPSYMTALKALQRQAKRNHK